jgi:hypothetical protein
VICEVGLDSILREPDEDPLGKFGRSVSDRFKPAKFPDSSDGFSGSGACGGGLGGSQNLGFKGGSMREPGGFLESTGDPGTPGAEGAGSFDGGGCVAFNMESRKWLDRCSSVACCCANLYSALKWLNNFQQ